MRHGGEWLDTTVKPGGLMTGIGHEFRDGSKVTRLEKVVLANGRELLVHGRR